jgi:lysophospholipase L1-like esterase
MHLKSLFFILVMLSQLTIAAESPLAIQTFKNLDSGKQQTVIVFGTSLSDKGAWAKETKRWFETTYPGIVNFVNASGSGKDSGWAVKNIKKVVSQKPDLIFIEFSYNDAKDSRIPLAKAKANLDEIVSAILSVNSSTDVIL